MQRVIGSSLDLLPQARFNPYATERQPACSSRWDAVRCRYGFRSHAPFARRRAAGATAGDRAAAVSGRLPRLQAGPPAARATRRLRDATRILGHRHRDRLDLRSGQFLPRRPRAYLVSIGRDHRPRARCAGEVFRLHRPDRARRARRAAAHHAGGPVGVPAPGARHAAATGADDWRARLSGRGAGSGPHHRRAAAQAGAVRGVGVPGGVDRGAGGAHGEPPAEPTVGTDDLPAGGWSVSDVGGEPRVSRLDGGRDSRGVERGNVLGGDERGVGAGGGGARGAGKAPAWTTTRCWARSGVGAGRRVMRKAAPNWRGRCWQHAASRSRPSSPACPASPSCPATPSSRPPPPASARPTSASVCSTGSQAAQLLQRLVRKCGPARRATRRPGAIRRRL